MFFRVEVVEKIRESWRKSEKIRESSKQIEKVRGNMENHRQILKNIVPNISSCLDISWRATKNTLEVSKESCCGEAPSNRLGSARAGNFNFFDFLGRLQPLITTPENLLQLSRTFSNFLQLSQTFSNFLKLPQTLSTFL